MAVIPEIESDKKIVPFIGENLTVYLKDDTLVVNIGDTAIRVETAKKPGQPWDQKAREDIEIARASYRSTWGDVPLWDDFDLDPNNLNYIAYVHYPSKTGEGLITEAMSLRMVLNRPEDLTFYQVNGVSLVDVMSEKLYLQRGLEPKPIAGESRMGAIRPPHSRSNEKTLEAFAAIKLQMVRDARALGIDYIACQLRPDLPIARPIYGTQFEFPHTEDILGMPKGSIQLNRDSALVVEHLKRYPGYFLDNEGIYSVVEGLIEEGRLSSADFRRHTGLQELNELRHARNIKSLVPLILSDNRVGIAFQDRLLNDVADGTYSSASHVNDLEERAKSILERVARFQAISKIAG